MTQLQQLGRQAKDAADILKDAGAQKNQALTAIANGLEHRCGEILEENQKDLAQGRAAGLTEALLDRLALNEARVKAMAQGAREVAALPDPVGRVLEGYTHPNGMKITKVTVPLGVIGMIYEARPNVTADAAVLCLKAGNPVILRGGKEAICSNRKIAQIMREAVTASGLPAGCIQLVEDTSRRSAQELMGLTGYLDVLIPRGGAGLIRAVVEQSRVPVIETGAGNCHIYVDRAADLEMAARIVENAKTSRPSVCNACEKVLVHQAVAADFLPLLRDALAKNKVELRGCSRTKQILGDCVIPATEEDWQTEYLDYILGIRVVADMEEALQHIRRYSTGHSEAVITNDYHTAQLFTRRVDSAAVYVNASTRFTDGGEFGLGAEIGISTQKLHARGPMGLNQLTSAKYIINGWGQVR